MIRAWNAWVRLCTSTEVGTSLALFRIGLGLTVFISAAGIYWTSDPLWRPLADGGLAPDRVNHVLVSLLGGPSLALARSIAATVLLSSIGLVVGLGGRLTALVALQGLIMLASMSFDVGGGFDRLTTNGLWLLVLGNSTATLSLDCRLRTGNWVSERQVYAFPRYLAVLQLIVVYVVTGLEKSGHGWHYPYEAIYRTFNRYPRLFWDLPWTGDIFPLTQVGTVVSWWWEVGFILLGAWFVAFQGAFGPRVREWARRGDLRVPFLGFGLFVHTILWVFLEVGTFSMVTFAFYFVMFDPAEWAAALRLTPKPAAVTEPAPAAER